METFARPFPSSTDEADHLAAGALVANPPKGRTTLFAPTHDL